jgi:ribosomal 50S subunit-associated protein YjgA (DUF615 family)
VYPTHHSSVAGVEETAEAKPPRHFRALFQALKALDEKTP